MKKILFILLIIIAISCSKDQDLSDSVFVNDKDFSGLPAYSEWGYNTFGANYERTTFKYSNSIIPLKILAFNKKLTYIFQGKVSSPGKYLGLKITLNDSTTRIYQDLLAYNDTIIDLSSNNVVVEFIDEVQNTSIVNITKGNLQFKKTQKVLIDDKEEQIIMSGYFDLEYINTSGIPEKMTNGRFDIGVTESIFYLII